MNRLAPILSWLTTVITPLALLGLSAQVVFTPAFLRFEYSKPGFPSDSYGFTTTDRIRWGPYGLRYLREGGDISYLGDLRFPDGSPLFSPRELSHMQDASSVAKRLFDLAYIVIGILVVSGFWSWRGKWWSTYAQGLRSGAWLTLAVAFAAGVVATLGASGSGDLFWQFFTDFHGLFFVGDSWLFAYSDTLIRLYPLQLFEDGVLYLGILTAVGAAVLLIVVRSRRHPSITAGA